MATVMTILSQNRRGPAIQKQLLYYPVTNAAFDTESYCRFAEGYYLYREGMMWFWDQYAPSEEARRQITASPLCAAVEQLKGLPDAMIINGEADVLRDEGEAYAGKLREAGVEVTALRVRRPSTILSCSTPSTALRPAARLWTPPPAGSTARTNAADSLCASCRLTRGVALQTGRPRSTAWAMRSRMSSFSRPAMRKMQMGMPVSSEATGRVSAGNRPARRPD